MNKATLLAAVLAEVAVANYQTFTLRYSADPAPLVVNGELFIYTSHDTADQVGWLMRDYNCFSTKDGVNFEDHGIVFTLDNSTWGTYAWAQQVTALGNGSYVMYYPAMQGSLDVGVAISEDPRGPFRDVLGHGIAPGDDPAIFQEVDGTAYLCSNNGGPFCGQLNEDMVAWARPQRSLAIANLPSGAWFEAPWLMRMGDAYHLSFMVAESAGVYGFAIGYATAPAEGGDPLTANFTYRGLLQWRPPYDCPRANVSATCPPGADGDENNHQGIVEWPAGSGRYWMAYHNTLLGALKGEYKGFQRSVALDRLYLDPRPGVAPGTLVPATSTPHWVRQQAWVDPYTPQAGVLMAPGSSLGLASEITADDPSAALGFRRDLGNITQGAWVRVQGVDFGSSPGAYTFAARVASPLSGGNMTLRLNSLSGTVIGVLSVPNTGGWQSYSKATCTTAAAVGVHDLYLVFNGANSDTGLFNLLWWVFEGGQASGGTPPPVLITLGMQAKGTSGGFLTAPSENGGYLTASAPAMGPQQTFTLVDNEDGSYGLQANSLTDGVAGLGWVCSVNGTQPLVASTAVTAQDPCASWRLQGTAEGSYVLQSQLSGLLVVAGPGAGSDGLLRPLVTDPRNVSADGARFWLVEL